MFKSFFNFIYTKIDKSKAIYLDHAAATPLGPAARKVALECVELYSNPSGIYASGLKVKSKLEESRKEVAKLLNCKNKEIVFTGSGTESNNLALLGYIKHIAQNTKTANKLKVITTKVEHSSVLLPLAHLEEIGLIDLVYVDVLEDGILDLKSFRDMLSKEQNIKLVSVMYANNETGAVQPVKEVGRIIAEHNRKNENKIAYHIDACQAANYLDIDIKKLRVNLMTINSSKIYGPKGIAALFCDEHTKLSPTVYGGGQEGGLRSGTESVERAAAMAAALREASLIKEKEASRLLSLQNKFMCNLKNLIPEAIIYTPVNNIKSKNSSLSSLPNIINIGLQGLLSEETVIRLSESGFEVSHKSACSSGESEEGSHVLLAMGRGVKESKENIRISMGRSTTQENMDNLVKEIKRIYYKYRVL